MFSMTSDDKDDWWFNLTKLLNSGLGWNVNQYVDDCFELIHAVNCFVWHQAIQRFIFSTYVLEKCHVNPRKGNTFAKCTDRWVFLWVCCFPIFFCSTLKLWAQFYQLHLFDMLRTYIGNSCAKTIMFNSPLGVSSNWICTAVHLSSVNREYTRRAWS